MGEAEIDGSIEVTAAAAAGACSSPRHRLDRNPVLAAEPYEIQILDGLIVGRARSHADARKKHWQLELEAGSLLHDVGPGQVVAALSKHFHQRLGALVAADVDLVAQACIGVVLLHPVEVS